MNTEENRLTQIGEGYLKFATAKSKQRVRYALYKCSCGNTREISMYEVNKNRTRSCGCLGLEPTITHGLTHHRLYRTWYSMNRRCNNIKDKNYKDYGGRGIKVCERWSKIENFIEDMYPTFEEGLTLDRINTNGNYEPKNCRWASASTQMRNKRKIQSNNKSGYRGVSFNTNDKNWKVCIGINSKIVRVGSFKTPLEGAKAYDTYVIQNNLEHTINGVLFSELI